MYQVKHDYDMLQRTQRMGGCRNLEKQRNNRKEREREIDKINKFSETMMLSD